MLLRSRKILLRKNVNALLVKRKIVREKLNVSLKKRDLKVKP
jgi:hypothetical protein